MDILSLPDGRQAQHWLGGADDGPVVLLFHGCPDTHLWYGEADERGLPGATWFAERVPQASLVWRPHSTHLATLADHWPDILATLTDRPSPC